MSPSNFPLLLLDVGNTRIKWRLSTPDWQEQGVGLHADLPQLCEDWSALPVLRVVGCTVASPQVAGAIDNYWRARGMAPEWIAPGIRAHGVTSHYQPPESLGADRWACLVGARKIAPNAPALIVSAGTAITVDGLTAQGEFLGGLILPGRRLMQHSLAVGTHALQAVDGRSTDWPRNTVDAMESGIATAASAAVERAYQRLSQPAQCVLTGGDAAWLSGHLTIRCTILPELIFEGLRAIALEDNPA